MLKKTQLKNRPKNDWKVASAKIVAPKTRRADAQPNKRDIALFNNSRNRDGWLKLSE